MNKILKCIKNPYKILNWIFSNIPIIGKKINDKTYLRIIYRAVFNKKLNLDNPITFNEKLQWLKLYDRKPIYTTMVDKYEAKRYVANIIGEEYIIPTLGVWDKFEDIDFDLLPDQFVLKCTHDSGGVVICKNKSELDMPMTKVKVKKSLKRNFYFQGREWPYKNVKPRIIAEEFLVDESGFELKDYKFFCFNGVPKFTLVCSERFSNNRLKEDFYDLNWQIMPMKRANFENSPIKTPRPKQYDLMYTLAKKLSMDIPFVRCDFYERNDKVYFGELTFFPASGLEGFEPQKWDKILGQWLNLNCIK